MQLLFNVALLIVGLLMLVAIMLLAILVIIDLYKDIIKKITK